MKFSKVIVVLAVFSLSAASVIRLPSEENLHNIHKHNRLKRQNAPSRVTSALATGVSTLATVGLGSLFGPLGTVVGAVAQEPLSNLISSIAGGLLGRDASVVTFRDVDGAVYFLGRVNTPDQRNVPLRPIRFYNEYR